jgi:hypothetical protein
MLVIVIVLLAVGAAGASAATLQPVGNFDQPISIASAPDDPDRLLVAERPGVVMQAEATGFGVFADLRSLVACCDGERGLLSIAPAPDFASSGRLYVAYTGKAAAGGETGDIHVDAFRRGPSPAQPIREPILRIGHSAHENHHGGQLQFGPDGYLYASTGDGGGQGDPLGSGQSLETLLGKVLRIDPRPGEEPPYVVPASNPFAGEPGLDEIWSYGFRNPWRFSFDWASGDMVIGDVGQGAREEVDLAPSPAQGVVGGAGTNYGWNCREGLIAYSKAPSECASLSGFVDPVFDYPHADPEDGSAHGCAIIGGYVVRDPSLGGLYGRYVYADYCAGDVRSLVLPPGGAGAATDDRSEGISVSSPIAFGQDSCGRIYLGVEGGELYRLVGPTPADCPRPVAAIGTKRPKRARLSLSAVRLGRPFEHRFKLTARLAPCGRDAGRKLRLKKGGGPWKAKRLSRRCVARFRARVAHRASFRAVLPRSADGTTIRSARRVVKPAGPKSSSSAARSARSRWRNRRHSGRPRASSSGREGGARP